MKGQILIFLVLVTGLLAHDCIHSKINKPPVTLMKIADEPNMSPHERKLQAKESIRIYADYTHVRAGTSAQRRYVQDELMPAAIAYYQAALKVRRFTVPISASFACPTGGYFPGSAVRSGVNADLIILVVTEASSESYLAYAMTCAIAQNLDNRPTYGLVNFNLNYLGINTALEKEENFLTTIHEIAHILGFSSSLYPFFVDSNLQTKTVLYWKMWNGLNVTYLNVEPLTTRLRNHFGCQTLEGGYLENEGSTGSAGSHWERQIFFNEFMTASSITDAVVSEFTLALFEGTGWYDVDYSFAETFRWGYNRGCTFVNDLCIDNSGNPIAQPEFCPILEREGCTFTGRAVGYCGTADKSRTYSSLISQFDYWGNNTIVSDSFSNNCPYMVGYSLGGDCEGPENQGYALISAEVYAVGSRCIEGTLSDLTSARPYTGFCLPIQCERIGPSYLLHIAIRNNTITCTNSGFINVQGFSGQLMCPDPTEYCNRANPGRCIRGCSGLGSCVDGICQCLEGWGGADCSTKSAPGVFQITFKGIVSLILCAIFVFF